MAKLALRIKEVQARIGRGRSWINDTLNPASRRFDPSFPKPFKLGAGITSPRAWDSDEIDAYIGALAARREPATPNRRTRTARGTFLKSEGAAPTASINERAKKTEQAAP